MLSHHRLDGLGCLVSVVEWNRADIVVENMGLHDAVKQGPPDEAKFSINSRCGTPGVGPGRRGVMR